MKRMYVLAAFVITFMGCATQKTAMTATAPVTVATAPVPAPKPAPPALAPDPVITPEGVEYSHLGIRIHPHDWRVMSHKLAVVPEGDPAIILTKGPATIGFEFFRGKTFKELVLKEAAAVEGKVPGVDFTEITGPDGRIVGFSIKGEKDGIVWVRCTIVEPIDGSDVIAVASLTIPGKFLKGAFQEFSFILSSIKPLLAD